jgi:Kef-type K+ transport system membrane component KefB
MADILQGLVGIRDYFHQNVIFGAGILLVCGFFGGRLAQKLRLPAITGYIVTGLLLGPSVLSLVPDTVAVQLEPIPHIALGLIAISIGGRFSMRQIRTLGKDTVSITLFQLVITFGAVTLLLIAFGATLPVALLLGAIASATAPAATVAVISEYRARGQMTDTLLATVALDDAGCIVLFSMTAAVCAVLAGGASRAVVFSSVLKPLWELGGSILIGLVVGYVVHRLVVNRRDRNEMVVIVLGFVLFCSAVAMDLHLSPLMTNMVLGLTLVNLSSKNERIFRMLEPLEAPIYAAFFALAGTELQLNLLLHVGVLGCVYIGARMAGKYLGSLLGAIVAGSSPVIRRYLGLCLFPQAGVAIGLVMIAQQNTYIASSEHAVQMVTIVLTSVLVNELIGPPIARYAIFRSGEFSGAGLSGSTLEDTDVEEMQA